MLALAGVVLSGGIALATPAAPAEANPYLPEWEHIPDGEPHVFEDPDNPGEYRLYIYGSHDTNVTSYCGTDLVLWSAPVDDLTDWQYEGQIFAYTAPGSDEPDTFYAPDIAEVEEEQADGTTKKVYYLYPHSRGPGRESMVAKSDSPEGPFEVINWTDDTKTETEGTFGFDPAVFVDDDGKVYGYWGFTRSFAAEIDENMYDAKPGTVIEDMISGSDDDDIWRFFEASSMRKVEDKYVLIYSRVTHDGESGLGASNATLAYAYSDTPLGPWTYGGTVVDARAPETGENGEAIGTLPANNTHGSIIEVDGQWYVFYHRAISGGYARQAMAEPINVSVTDDGAVEIEQAEVTSSGLDLDGLDPYETTSAGLASWLTGGASIPRIDNPNYPEPSDITAPVQNTTDGSIVGYKYFTFDEDPAEDETTELTVNLTPQGVDGTIDIMLDRPWSNEHNDGVKLGSIEVSADDPAEATDYTTRVSGLDDVEGEHAVYFVFHSDSGDSVAELHNFTFDLVDAEKPTATLVSPADGGPVSSLDIQVDATDNAGLQRIVANIYQDGKLVKSTQTAADGATSASHTAEVSLPSGSYTIRYNAQDLAGNISTTGSFDVTVDATAPKVTVKTGDSYTVGSDGVYELVSFKLFDSGKIDKIELNGVTKDLSNNTWSDLNYVKPGVFGAVEGENTLVVYDVAGNTETYTFDLE